MNIHARASVAVVHSPYSGFDRLPIAGEWRLGKMRAQSVVDLPNCPFGGEKNSGIGRFNGDWIIEAFTTDQWATVQHTPRRYPWTV